MLIFARHCIGFDFLVNSAQPSCCPYSRSLVSFKIGPSSHVRPKRTNRQSSCHPSVQCLTLQKVKAVTYLVPRIRRLHQGCRAKTMSTASWTLSAVIRYAPDGPPVPSCSSHGHARSHIPGRNSTQCVLIMHCSIKPGQSSPREMFPSPAMTAVHYWVNQTPSLSPRVRLEESIHLHVMPVI